MSDVPQPVGVDPPANGATAMERPRWVSLLPRTAVDPLATAFLGHLEVRGMSWNTLLAYGRALESLIELVGPLDELRLDADCVHRFLSHLRQTPSRHRSAADAASLMLRCGNVWSASAPLRTTLWIAAASTGILSDAAGYAEHPRVTLSRCGAAWSRRRSAFRACRPTSNGAAFSTACVRAR